MPAYNEGNRIYHSLQNLKKVLKAMKLDYEIIVVDDGSKDNTLVESKRAASKLGNIKVIGYKTNRGKGYAIKVGVKSAGKSLITFLDADTDFNPKQIAVLIDYMKKYDADVVVGSKRHPLTKIHYPLGRRILSKCYNLMINLLMGLNISDTQSGIKLYNKKVLEKILPHLLVKRFAIDVEMLAYANYFGYKIIEAPIVLDFSKGKWGRISPREIWRIFIDTLAVARRFQILQMYAKIIRDIGIGVLLFGSGIWIYKKYFNPFSFPFIEDRILYALIAIGFVLFIFSIPYEKIAKRMR